MGVILGWASIRKYGILGGLRAIVSSLSFEIRLVFLGFFLVAYFGGFRVEPVLSYGGLLVFPGLVLI